MHPNINRLDAYTQSNVSHYLTRCCLKCEIKLLFTEDSMNITDIVKMIVYYLSTTGRELGQGAAQVYAPRHRRNGISSRVLLSLICNRYVIFILDN